MIRGKRGCETDMRLGCCVNMLADRKDPVGQGYLPLLARLGYDYAELPLAQVMELTEGEFRDLLRSLKASGIPCECCNNFFPKTIRLTGKEARRAEAEAYLREALQRASLLGAKIVVFGSSGAKNVPEGFPADQAFEQISDVLEAADKAAGDCGIQIAIEPLCRLESNLILNLADADRLMRARPYQNVRLLVDYYHYSMERERPEALEKAAENIIHVHFADPGGRVYPGAMRPEFRAFLDLLKKRGYGGRISAEAYSSFAERDLTRFLQLFRD